MTFIIVSLLTIGITFAMEYSLGLKVYKDVADNGYKFNIKRNREVSDNFIEDNSYDKIIRFIPFMNIFNEISRVANYKANFDSTLSHLASIGVISRMDEAEKSMYEKKPTGFNSVYISKNAERIRIERERLNKIIIHHENEDSTISYKLGDKTNILSTSGPISNMTEEEQKDVLLKASIAIILKDRRINELLGINFKEANDEVSVVEMNDNLFTDPDIQAALGIIKNIKSYIKDVSDEEEVEIYDIEIEREKTKSLKLGKYTRNKKDSQ
jgi:hypothetical protein